MRTTPYYKGCPIVRALDPMMRGDGAPDDLEDVAREMLGADAVVYHYFPRGENPLLTAHAHGDSANSLRKQLERMWDHGRSELAREARVAKMLSNVHVEIVKP